MSTYNNPPPADLYLAPEETQREVALYMLGRARQTGESTEQIQRRMSGVEGGPNLLEFLGKVQVIREKHAPRYEYEPHQTNAADGMDRLKAMPDVVRQTIATSAVVEGDAVHAMRQWQELKGDRSRGLLLLGPAGAGKTLHACLLLRGNVLDIEPEGWIIGESMLSMHLGTGTKDHKEKSLGPMIATPLLVVDYMGQRKTQAVWEAAVLEFMRMRWEAGKRCVLTFRGDLDAFKGCYGADGWATVERFCTVVRVRRGS